MSHSSLCICGFSLCPWKADLEGQLKVISGIPAHERGRDQMMAEISMVSVCDKTRLWAVLLLMVTGLGPGVSLLTRLWEATQACVQVISTDQITSFLRQFYNPFRGPANPGGRAALALKPASKLHSRLGGTVQTGCSETAHRAGRRGRWET